MSEELDEYGNPIEDDHSDNPEGKSGQEPEKYQIGDKEYTAEQIADLETRAGKYNDLLPEFTQKSQKLSELEKLAGGSKPDENKAPYEDPNWKPKDYRELADAIKDASERGASKALAILQQKEQEQQETKTEMDNFFAGIKAKDKDFDEQDFSDFALRHHFPVKTVNDLQAVYSAYAELQKASELGTETGRKSRENRNDKVNNPSGGSGKGPDYSDINASGGSIFDKAREALLRTKH